MSFHLHIILSTFGFVIFVCFVYLTQNCDNIAPISNQALTDRYIRYDRVQYLSYTNEQTRSRIEQNTKSDSVEALFFSYTQEIVCSTKVRIGGFGDGGKWTCNPWRMPIGNCTVYSIGIGRNVQFDLEIFKTFRCRLYAFDPNPNYGNSLRKQASSLATNISVSNLLFFRPWLVETRTNFAARRASLTKMFEHFRTERVDVLKIDAEGNEFDILNELYSSKRNVRICQLLLEVHNRSVDKWRALFVLLNKVGFLLFSSEANVYSIRPSIGSFCVEYSYIHKTCLENFGLTHDATVTSNFNNT